MPDCRRYVQRHQGSKMWEISVHQDQMITMRAARYILSGCSYLKVFMSKTQNPATSENRLNTGECIGIVPHSGAQQNHKANATNHLIPLVLIPIISTSNTRDRIHEPRNGACTSCTSPISHWLDGTVVVGQARCNNSGGRRLRHCDFAGRFVR